jgi:hypothetical protein
LLRLVSATQPRSVGAVKMPALQAFFTKQVFRPMTMPSSLQEIS